jgi:hypothetical protein
MRNCRIVYEVSTPLSRLEEDWERSRK